MKLAAVFVLLLAVGAQAQDRMGTTQGRLTDEYVSGVKPVGFAPILGANAGYTNYDSQVDVEGMPASAKLIGSFYTYDTKAVFDLGYGLMNQQFSQTYAPNSAVTNGVLEAAARYQWDNRWQAGVVMNTFFNEGTAYGANQADAQFAGLQALKEFDIARGWFARVGGRLMTDINVDDRTLGLAMIDLQIGWNPAARATTVREVAAAPARPVTTERKPAMTLINNGVEMVNFQFDSAAVPSQDAARLEKLAQVLKDNRDLYASVEVVGYADPIGTPQYNDKLSDRRADRVADVLKQAGLAPRLLQTEGRGATDLIATSESDPDFAKNRRVEINFKGVKDEAKLREIISTIE